jgi:hypothetical protein
MRLREAVPQLAHRGAGAVGAIADEALNQHDPDKRTGRHTADRIDLKSYLEEAIQHTPGEGAMRASAL